MPPRQRRRVAQPLPSGTMAAPRPAAAASAQQADAGMSIQNRESAAQIFPLRCAFPAMARPPPVHLKHSIDCSGFFCMIRAGLSSPRRVNRLAAWPLLNVPALRFTPLCLHRVIDVGSSRPDDG